VAVYSIREHIILTLLDKSPSLLFKRWVLDLSGLMEHQAASEETKKMTMWW